MNNRGTTRYVFASSYTNQGFYTFIPELVNSLGKVYILKGAPGSGKSTFIRLLGELMSQQGYDVEFWVSSIDPVTPDGVYIPQLDAAVINGSLPRPIEPKYPGVRDIIINLDEYWDRSMVQEKYEVIIEQLDRIDKCQQQTISLLKEAGWAKEEISRANGAHLNMEKIEQLSKDLSGEIMDKRPGEKHYFVGVITHEGLVNYIDELSADCKKRYIFRGPAGTGKSTVINELISQARQRGYSLEYYHCGLEVDYLIMVVIRNLQVALIEASHVEIIIRQGDTVVDMTRYLEDYDSDRMAINSSAAYRRYETLLLEAQQELENISQSTREVKKVYTAAMDFERLDHKRQEIADEIRRTPRTRGRFSCESVLV